MFDFEKLPISERTWLATADKVMDVILDDTISDDVRNLRTNALEEARRILNAYIKQNIPDGIIDAIRRKRFDFIMQAATAAQVREINSFTPPRYNSGSIVIDSKFHIEEEELIAWSRVSLLAPLSSLALERIDLLFRKYGKHFGIE